MMGLLQEVQAMLFYGSLLEDHVGQGHLRLISGLLI